MESDWRWNVAEQGLSGYTGGPGLPPVRLAARLHDVPGAVDWLVDWRLPSVGWYVRIPNDIGTPYTYGQIFGHSGNFPYGFDVPPDRV